MNKQELTRKYEIVVTPGIITGIFDQVKDEIPVSTKGDGNSADDHSADDHDETDALQWHRIQQWICLQGCKGAMGG